MNLNYAKKEEKVTMIRNILKKTSYWVHEYLIFKDFFFDIAQKGDSNFDISPSFNSTFLKEQYHD